MGLSTMSNGWTVDFEDVVTLNAVFFHWQWQLCASAPDIVFDDTASWFDFGISKF